MSSNRLSQHTDSLTTLRNEMDEANCQHKKEVSSLQHQLIHYQSNSPDAECELPLSLTSLSLSHLSLSPLSLSHLSLSLSPRSC